MQKYRQAAPVKVEAVGLTLPSRGHAQASRVVPVMSIVERHVTGDVGTTPGVSGTIYSLPATMRRSPMALSG